MFRVRPATHDDVDALAFVNVTAWREAYGHFLSPEFFESMTVESRRERWRRSVDDGFPTNVLEVDGEVRGYSSAGIPLTDEKPRDLQLYMIYQLASEYGTGSGQALLDAAIADNPAFVWVAEQNPRAIAFYRRNGFEPDGASIVAEQWENLVEFRMVR
jgi:ribosomal protein S18 acetylase RimI-like enzyme